jgi:hypothetical protein
MKNILPKSSLLVLLLLVLAPLPCYLFIDTPWDAPEKMRRKATAGAAAAAAVPIQLQKVGKMIFNPRASCYCSVITSPLGDRAFMPPLTKIKTVGTTSKDLLRGKNSLKGNNFRPFGSCSAIFKTVLWPRRARGLKESSLSPALWTGRELG